MERNVLFKTKLVAFNDLPLNIRIITKSSYKDKALATFLPL